MGPVILLVGHLVQTLVANAPSGAVKIEGQTQTFTNASHNLVCDMMILAILLMMTGANLTYAGSEKTKSEEKKKYGMKKR